MEHEKGIKEWIVCKNQDGKQNPRLAVPCRIVVTDDDSWNIFNRELMKTGEYAYLRKSYESCFKKYNLDSLPRRKY